MIADLGNPPKFSHSWSSEVFAGIGSVLGKPIKMDVHRAAGINREAARILVMMEANRDFSDEVSVFMTNDEGEEMEEVVQIVYRNPPPRCGDVWHLVIGQGNVSK